MYISMSNRRQRLDNVAHGFPRQKRKWKMCDDFDGSSVDVDVVVLLLIPGNFLAFELLPQLSSEWRAGARACERERKRCEEGEWKETLREWKWKRTKKEQYFWIRWKSIYFQWVSTQRDPNSNRRISNGIYTAFFQTFIVCSLHLFGVAIEASECVCVCVYSTHCVEYVRIHWMNGFKPVLRCAVEWPGQKPIVHISI